MSKKVGAGGRFDIFLDSASSSLCLLMNKGWSLLGHERVTEARLLLKLLV